MRSTPRSTEPMAVALHGITRAGGARPGTRWLVTGGGPIGFLSVAALRALGVDDVVVSEPHEKRRELCERLGARTVHPDELQLPAMPHDIVDEPFDVALECSGNNKAMEAALAQLKRAGTLVLVGAGIRAPRFDNNRILLNELVITGAFVYDARRLPRARSSCSRPATVPLDVLVEADDVPLDGLLDAALGLHEGTPRGQGDDRPDRYSTRSGMTSTQPVSKARASGRASRGSTTWR